MIKAVFFDIDGTLREFEESGIPAYTRTALKLAADAGLRLCIATGRHWLEIEEEGLLADLVFDAYVTLNGQLCYEREGGHAPGRAVYRNPIPQDQVERLFQLLKEEPFPCLFMEEDRMYMNYIDRRVEEVQQGIGTALPPVEDIRRALKYPVYQIVPYAGAAGIERIVRGLPGCSHAVWHDGGAIDLLPAEGGKCRGIQEVIQRWGLAPEEIAAVGDGANDVSMLRFAGVGIAMGNGCAAAREAADYVTGHIREGGLVEAMEYLLRRNEGCE